MKNIRISPLVLPTFLITLFLGVHKPYLLAFFTALFHETGHLLACSREKVSIRFIRLEPFGISFMLKEDFFKSTGAEIKVSLAGPFINFLVGGFFLFFKDKGMFLAVSNFFMGVFNLIPCLPLDGGRVLKSVLCEKYGYLRGYKITLFISRIISFFLVGLGLYLVIKTGFNFSLIIIGGFLFFSLFKEKNYSTKYILKEMSEYKEKHRRLEKMAVKQVVISKDLPVLRILDSLSFSGYHIFTVIENGKIEKTFTEGELFEALLKHGGRIKISEI